MRKRTLIAAFFLILFSFIITLAQQVVITGKLTGCDGKPMIKGQVSVGSYKAGQIISSTEAGKDGSYRISINKSGLIYLKFAGVNHRYKLVPLVLDDTSSDFKLDVQLQAFQYTDFKRPLFLDLSDPPERPTEFKEQADGTYVVEIETNKKRLEYGIGEVEKSYAFISGTQAEDYIYAGNGTGLYKSGINVKNGKIKITLDPKKLLRSNTKPQVKIETKDIHLAAFVHFYDKVDQQQTIFLDDTVGMIKKENRKELLREYTDTNKPLETQKANLVKAHLNDEKDPFVRQLLLIEYFTYRTGETEQEFVKLAINEIPPSSTLWTVESNWIVNLLEKCQPEEKEKYLSRFLVENRNIYAKSQVLLALIRSAKQHQSPAEMQNYYNLLMKDYNDTAASYEAEVYYPECSKINVGNIVPEFSFISLKDKSEVISNTSLKGKYYLIDFWATWCGPCVGEMANLHKAYEKFKEKNFEILSISLDENPEAVTKFRQEKWKMPWFNSFIENPINSDLAKRFEVLALPKAILVNPEGKIIAVEKELRGNQLDETLTRILGKAE